MIDPIPLSLVQAGRDLTEPRISPDGAHVAFVQRWRGQVSIDVVSFDTEPYVERLVTHGPDPAPGRGLGGGCFTWITQPDGRLAIAYVATDGELWRQDGARVERLTEHGSSLRAPAVATRPSDPSDNRVDRHLVYVVDEAEVWWLDLSTGESRRLDDGRHEFCFDPALSPDETVASWAAWNPPDMPWDGSVRVDAELASGAITVTDLSGAAIQQPRFTPSGEHCHVHDGSGWLNVYVDARVIVDDPAEQAGPTWGMGTRSYAFDDTGERMALTRNEDGFGALYLADVATGEIAQVARGVHGHLTWAGDRLVALRSGARTPTQIVGYDVAPGRHDPTSSTIAWSQAVAWSTDELPEPEVVVAPSRDGMSALYARHYAAGRGRMLCWVHGGPTDQWQVEWRPRFAYWWSRGWDVLVVDPRGSTGFGRAYQQALRGGWGRLDVDDTADLIRHAQAQDWATPQHTVVMGGSSGGLTVLGVMADHPELVAGGVSSYPVSDLGALAAATHRFEAHYTDTLVAPLDGSEETTRLFDELSPIGRAERIGAPLLLFHGDADEVVSIDQSRVLVERIGAAGGDVTFVVYEDEGHGFRDPGHVRDEYERTEAFLDRFT